MSEAVDENTRRIDVWGAVVRLWRFKWIWLLIFGVVTAAGAVFALSRPANSSAKQWVELRLPAVATDADAMQQTALLSPLALSYVEYATTPPSTDDFVKLHPEFKTPDDIKAAVTVQLRNVSLMEFIATGPEAEKQGTLARDLATSFVASLASDPAEHLRLDAKLYGDPMITSVASNRSLLLGATALAGAAFATIVVAVLAYGRKAEHTAD